MTSFMFTPVDVPGSSSTSLFDINDSGKMVGSYTDGAGQAHGFVDTNGHFSTIDVPGAISTVATGINDFGDIVGSYNDAAGEHGFLQSHGHISTIDMPGGTGTYLSGINNAGKIVGSASLPVGHQIREVAFVDNHGSFNTISVPGYPDGPPAPIGGTYLTASGINDLGWIAVNAHVAPGSFSGDAFIDAHGGFTRIVPPDAIMPPAVGGMNDLGQVVGTYNSSTGGHGYVDSKGSFTIFDVPNATYTEAGGINNSGEIVGSYNDSFGHHGFVGTPDTPPLNAASVLGYLRPGFVRP